MDPASVLGVAPWATEREVDLAWRRRVREVHPDLHPDADAVERERLACATRRLNAARDELRARHVAAGWSWEHQGVRTRPRPPVTDPLTPEAVARLRDAALAGAADSVGALLTRVATFFVGLYWVLLLALHTLG